MNHQPKIHALFFFKGGIRIKMTSNICMSWWPFMFPQKIFTRFRIETTKPCRRDRFFSTHAVLGQSVLTVRFSSHKHAQEPPPYPFGMLFQNLP